MASSFDDLNHPVLTFVGRPTDWNKGLATFLDALERLAVASVPVFEVWLVGGSEREMRTVRGWIGQRANASKLRERGLLTIWGRVAPDALPEIFSRSSVMVMPSNREQFGIAAVEAMMCGCPVLASRVGGLPHIVIDGRVGHLITPGDDEGLAFSLAGLLQLRHYWRHLGKSAASWAGDNFSQPALFERLRTLYAGHEPSPHCVESSPDWFAPVLGKAQLLVVEQTLGFRANRVDICGETQGGATFAIEAGDRRAVAKRIGTDPDFRGSIFGIAKARRPADDFSGYRAKLEFMNGSSLAPFLIRTDIRRRLLVLEWMDGTPAVTYGLVLRKLRDWRPAPTERSDELLSSVAVLRRCRTRHALQRVDIAAAAMNAPCHGGALPVHPAVELERVRRHLGDGRWPLEPKLNQRLLRRIGDHIDALGDEDGTVALCHGDLRPCHVVATPAGPKLIGLRKLHYAVGELDEARWALYTDGGLQNEHLDGASQVADSLLRGERPRVAIAWAAAEVLTEAFCAAARGRVALFHEAPSFLKSLLTSQENACAFQHPEGSRPVALRSAIAGGPALR